MARTAIKVNDLPNISAKRIVLIKPSALGDVVQTLPLLPALRRRFPEAEIHWVIASNLADLLAGHPDLASVIPFDRKGGLHSWWSLLKRLRNLRCDLAFDLQGLLRSAAMTWASRAPLRIGLQTTREGSHFACHLILPNTSRDVPAYARYQQVAKSLGVACRPDDTQVATTAQETRWLNDVLPQTPNKVLAVQPGAQWETKRWPPEKFAEIAARAIQTYHADIILVGSPDEHDLAKTVEQAIQSRLTKATGAKGSPPAIVTGNCLNSSGPHAPRVINLAGKTTLKQLAVLLRHVDLLLTNDSGPMHLAAGLGTPVVGLFTCTLAERSGPPPGPHALVSTEVQCAGSYCKACPHRGPAHLQCLRELGTDRVWAAMSQLIECRLQWAA